jgi:hypothetical protein
MIEIGTKRPLLGTNRPPPDCGVGGAIAEAERSRAVCMAAARACRFSAAQVTLST